jgi:hypothetical protein
VRVLVKFGYLNKRLNQTLLKISCSLPVTGKLMFAF